MSNFDFTDKPLKEVLLRLKYQAEPDERALAQIGDRLATLYPETRQRRAIVGGGLLGGMNMSERFAAPVHVSQDQRTAVQVGPDGFYFSQLAPYEGWPQLQDEANTVWKFCRPCLNIEVIRSISVRFINLFELPGSHEDLPEYLKFAPPAPTSIGNVEGFFNRWTIGLEDERSFARIIQTMRPPSRHGRQRIVLDIEVTMRIYEFLSDEQLWTDITHLRDIAHMIFRDSLTSKANDWIQ
jgi:uncharacterized protein (TIGR04255 family)